MQHNTYTSFNNRRLLTYAKKLSFSKSWSYGLARGLKHVFNPGQLSTRKSYAINITVPNPIQDGYQLFQPTDFPDIPLIVQKCQAIADEKLKLSHLERDIYQVGKLQKDFLLTILGGEEFLLHPDLFKFAISRPILDRVCSYFNSVPLFVGARLWWSPPNQTLAESQLFHIDTEDKTQLKMFVNIYDVTEQHGPLAFLPARATAAILNKLRLKPYVTKRWADEKVLTQMNRHQLIKLTGVAGTGGFVDTSKCLHYGSRANIYDRVVLMLHYQRFDVPKISNAFIHVPADYHLLSSFDTVQKLALGYKN